MHRHRCHGEGRHFAGTEGSGGRGQGGGGGRGGEHGGGRGGPFGRHRGGPFGGGGKRMFDAGALRLVVLGLIAEQPRHGYDIIKALEARFQGAYSPSPGAIYPMLQMLEEADLVSSQMQGAKKLFAITAEGQAYLEENRVDLDRINAQIDEASEEIQGVSLGAEFRALRRTLFQQLRRGELSAPQAQQALEILKKAREDIERLQAGSDKD
ncbi:MAG: PadR family transcriptional regulator [Hoeflea sp.]|nr:PadR family transcriptional regulator [Alphaproteobacteria bacterium]MBV1722949.1 PadR family transcriptional regulator [Hoeflea sp.]MBU4542832.1 PadR family transcriptional regulator [Alphaproteobacteria bacterium]MBU4552644.1 PadR family transcriptional regulator [Alphaproteobacteria bacterium]MBV1762860.1 PadR family transcriptional regulator [Hoeflea sp.]